MKYYLLSFLLMLAGCCADSSAQCKEDCKSCTGKNTTQTIKDKEMKTQTADKAVTCKLTSPELRKRKEEVINNLKQQVIEMKELKDGYAYKFYGSDEILDSLTSFIKSERICCDFLNFKMVVSNDTSVWLEISGDENAKAFIKTELEM